MPNSFPSKPEAARHGRSVFCRERAVLSLRGAIEAVALLMICLSPWAYGAAEARFESLLYAGVAAMLVLWALRMLLERRLTWAKSPVAVCLAALFLLGAVQQLPLPGPVLARLSPATHQLYDRLLPAQPEILPFGTERKPVAAAAGSTLSLYPEATRRLLLKLLAVFCLFAVLINNVASSGALWRLAVVALVNGALLALFGLVQFFTSPDPGTIYWTDATDGSVFGPFVNRNHFAFYINLCIGLGLGLLFAGSGLSRRPMGDSKTRSVFEASWIRQLGELLHEPRALWISGALALMVSSVGLCLSRGGLLALLGSAAVCLASAFLGRGRSWRAGTAVLVAAMALGLLVCFGMDRVEARWSTIWSGEGLQKSRLPIWSKSGPLVRDFCIFGTGYGTFLYAERPYLHTPHMVGRIYEHAHNDYLEAAIEGGAVRLLLSLLAIGFVFQSGLRAIRNQRGSPHVALLLGALFAFTTTVIHSSAEFGLFIPAIAVLVTAVCAQLCNPAGGRPEVGGTGTSPADENGADRYVLRCLGLAPVAGAAIAVALGVLLYYEGSRMARLEQLKRTVVALSSESDPASLERRLHVSATLVRLAPTDADLRAELAELHFYFFREQRSRLGESPPPGYDPVARAHLVAALEHYLAARDLCPLLPLPHVRLAANTANLARADPPERYMERVKFLAPADPELWYVCGREELAKQQFKRGWKSWQRSLELSDRLLPPILEYCALNLSSDQILENVLPDSPDILVAAAWQLYPAPEATGDRQPFLEKALSAFEQQAGSWKAEDLRLKASVHRSLGHTSQAIAAYQVALGQQPQQVGWRFEFAQFLYEQGRVQESRRELLLVLGQQPKHAEASRLLEVVVRELAEGAS